jgi:hypothetical protein
MIREPANDEVTSRYYRHFRKKWHKNLWSVKVHDAAELTQDWTSGENRAFEEPDGANEIQIRCHGGEIQIRCHGGELGLRMGSKSRDKANNRTR